MKSIGISLNGGIGNLLFQLAAARTLHAMGYRVSLVEMNPGLYSRLATYVGNIDIPLAGRRTHHLISSRLVGESTRISSASKIASYLIPPICIEELEFDAPIPNVINLRTRVLNGYFQNQEWYYSQTEKICSAIESNRPARIPQSLDGVVGVHLRRSDYVRLGWDLSESYYLEVLNKIRSTGRENVIVVSDDQLTESLFITRLRAIGFNSVEKNKFMPSSALRDFYLLSASEHIYMSNSTFSWWSAKLHDHIRPNANDQIHCPDRWLPDGRGENLIAEGWDLIGASFSRL